MLLISDEQSFEIIVGLCCIITVESIIYWYSNEKEETLALRVHRQEIGQSMIELYLMW
jgi:hypothetical protein